MDTNRKRTIGLSRPRWMEALKGYLWGPGRWLAGMVLLAAAFALGAWLGWQMVGEQVLFSDAYLVRKEHLCPIPPKPDWIRSDVLEQVFRTAVRDGPLYLWQENLCQHLAEAFRQHPWVARVQEVRKNYPAHIEIRLQWRRPVCMVLWQQVLLPVDPEGIVLPGENFSPAETVRYPRLAGIPTPPPKLPGARWQDVRVLEGVQIAAALQPLWEKFRLAFIQPMAMPPGAGTETIYELHTHTGSRIIWGLGPCSHHPAEPALPDKIARLQRYVQQYGSLDGPHGPQTLDLRLWPADTTEGTLWNTKQTNP